MTTILHLHGTKHGQYLPWPDGQRQRLYDTPPPAPVYFTSSLDAGTAQRSSREFYTLHQIISDLGQPIFIAIRGLHTSLHHAITTPVDEGTLDERITRAYEHLEDLLHQKRALRRERSHGPRPPIPSPRSVHVTRRQRLFDSIESWNITHDVIDPAWVAGLRRLFSTPYP